MAGPSTELKLFEALETYTNHDSFCSKASFVQNFLERDLDLNNTQQSLQIEDISEEDEEEEQEEEEGDDSDGSSYLEVDTGNNTSLFEEDEKQQQPREGKRVTFLGGNGRDALLKLLLQKHHRKEVAEANETGSVRSDAVDEEEEVDEEEKQEVSVTEEDEEEDEEEEEDEVDEEPEESDVVETQHKRNEPDSVENWNQYFQLLELKRALEEKQAYLEKEKENFSKMKGLEENRMKEEKKRVESQRKSLQKIMTDYNKIKFSKEEYEEKIKQLSDQLKETKLQMNKRITRWGDQQRRLEERVKALEKENEELKKKDQRSIPDRLAALKRPPMRCLTNKKPKEAPPKTQLRRVQFADSCEINEMEEEEVKENDNSKSVQDSSASSTSTFFSESFFRSPESQNKSRLEGGSPKESNGNQNDSCPYEKDVHLSDDEADKTMPSDYKEIKHPCGTITRITNDNKLTRHILMNKDVMDEFEDSSVRYYYHELGFAQTTYPNGDEVIEYDSGEIETKRADGSKIYTYSNGLVKMIDGISGSEEVVFGDGSVMKKSSDGLCTTITWPSGQKEERTPDYVKRIYTNGTVKIMYKDGSEETRYFNGRVRRKDKNGVLVDDTKFSKKSKSNKAKATA